MRHMMSNQKAVLLGTVCTVLLVASGVKAQLPLLTIAVTPLNKRSVTLQNSHKAIEGEYKRLAVTPAQRKKLEALDNKYLAQALGVMSSLPKGVRLTAEQRAKRNDALRETNAAYFKQWMGVLTPAQRDKLRAVVHGSSKSQ